MSENNKITEGVPYPPNSALIKQLNGLLEEAKSGELQGMVYVCSYKGNSVSHGWAVSSNIMRIIGEIEQVKWHLLAMDE